MKLVFMGTPDFAAAHLKALVEAGFDVRGVFTQPDKPRSRMKMSFSPVKEVALGHSIPVFQPETLRDEKAYEDLKALDPDLLVVVAYGKILPDEFITYAPLGCINVHGSLLPKYRGAAPIQWAVLNGDTHTGVTTMYIAHDVDAGDIIYTSETEIGEFETSGELFERLRDMGAKLLCRTVRDIEDETAPRIPQDHSMATHTTQLSKQISQIDWAKTPREIVKWICGLDPWPAATMEIAGNTMKVHKAEYTDLKTDKEPGQIVFADKRGIGMACKAGDVLLVTEIQAAGSKRMRAADYLLGHPIEVD